VVDTKYYRINLVFGGVGLGIRRMNLSDEELQKSCNAYLQLAVRRRCICGQWDDDDGTTLSDRLSSQARNGIAGTSSNRVVKG
jgi:hypothetical protein